MMLSFKSSLLSVSFLTFAATVQNAGGFQILSSCGLKAQCSSSFDQSSANRRCWRERHILSMAEGGDGTTTTPEEGVVKIEFESDDEKNRAVGNLVADDEWMGLSMELSEIVRVAILEDLKTNARDFLGKEDYKVGDISKEIDARVKDQIAQIRGKDEYELGDVVLALDELSKQMTEEFTGKPYEVGDLSIELDTRIKSAITDYCGTEEYQVGDLSKAIASRIQTRVEEFTGKPGYEFGDVARALERQRKDWVRNYLGDEAAANYQPGDITRKFVAGFTGKEEYQFGDVTKTILGNLFGGDKKK